MNNKNDTQDIIACPECEGNNVTNTIGWMGSLGVLTTIATALPLSGGLFTEDVRSILAYITIIGVLLIFGEVIRMSLPLKTQMVCKDCSKSFMVDDDTFQEYVKYNNFTKNLEEAK